jgi:hypothetical protein
MSSALRSLIRPFEGRGNLPPQTAIAKLKPAAVQVDELFGKPTSLKLFIRERR